MVQNKRVLSMNAFLLLHPLSFYIITVFIYQAELVLIFMGLYWPTFSLMFVIHLFLYASVYCNWQTVIAFLPYKVFICLLIYLFALKADHILRSTL